MGAGGKVVAIGNLKGGVGKSTLAVNIGCALAAAGHGTVVIDTDPQQTAVAWTRGGKRLPCHVRPRPIRELSAVGDWLGELAAARQGFARVVIDLPAVLSPALAAAFLAADAILIPTSFSPVDLEATRRTLRHARIAAAERRDRPPLILAVPMLVRRGWLGKPQPPVPRRRLMEVASAPPIGFDAAFADAFEQGDWIGARAPRSRAHRELQAVVALLEAGLAGELAADAGARPEPEAAALRPEASPGAAQPPPAGGGRRRSLMAATAA